MAIPNKTRQTLASKGDTDLLETSPEVMQRPAFGALIRFSLKRIWYPAWLLPWILVWILVPAHVNGWLSVPKQPAEIASPILLGIALLAALVHLARERNAWGCWLSALLFTFLCREFHFAGTSTAVYIGVLGLFMLAWLRYPWFADHLGSGKVLTPLSTALMCYFVAVGLDSHWWKFLPGDKYDWAHVEEYIELTGHLLLLKLALFPVPVTPRPDTARSSSTQP